MLHYEWVNDYINIILKESEEYLVMLNLSYNFISSILYRVCNGKIEYNNHLDNNIFEKCQEYFKHMKEYGIHIFKYVCHKLYEHKIISHYNVELGYSEMC